MEKFLLDRGPNQWPLDYKTEALHIELICQAEAKSKKQK